MFYFSIFSPGVELKSRGWGSQQGWQRRGLDLLTYIMVVFDLAFVSTYRNLLGQT